MDCFIGVDIGTTHTKALAVLSSGQVLHEAKTGYPTWQSQEGHSEQDPALLLDAVVDVLRNVIAALEGTYHIAAVGFSAAMHSIMPIDEAGRPLAPLYTWADTRSHKEAALLNETENGRRIYGQTGTPIHPMSPLCKISWMRRSLPEIFSRAARFVSGKEYVLHALTGGYLIDYSMASATGLFNIHRKDWEHEALSFAGIQATQLSTPVSPFHILPALREPYSQATGIKQQVPFVIGATDGILAILGTGATGPGEAALTIGTSGAVRRVSTKPVQDTSGRLFNYLVDDNMYMCGGAINNGGIVLKWFAENVLDKPFVSDEAFTSFIHTALRAPAGSEGLLFLPYIYGERSPVWDANARGVFLGVGHLHTKEHFMRAILEGISFSLSQILKAMEETGEIIDVIYASGGFIQAPGWVQLLSDILNKKIIVSYAGDASAMGAAFVGMFTLGVISDWSVARANMKTSTVFYPDAQAHSTYRKNMDVFQRLYPTLKGELNTLAGRT